ncbi:CopL family metal-binding regulatory protein [Pseudoxanthomonas wuyuanensis]
MPSAKSLLRVLLIFVLCTEGILGAWASTRMAIGAIAHADAAAAAGQGTVEDCEDGSAADRQQNGDSTAHQDCDCGSQAFCGCSCMVTFYPLGGGVLFAAQHALASVYLSTLRTHSVRNEISPVFRPPIA